jgi:hypothetical protein
VRQEGALNGRSGEEAVLEGVLVPVSWGPDGSVSEVSLMTFDEDEYRIETTVAAALALADHLRKHVRLRGRTHRGRIVAAAAVEILELRGSPATERGAE